MKRQLLYGAVVAAITSATSITMLHSNVAAQTPTMGQPVKKGVPSGGKMMPGKTPPGKTTAQTMGRPPGGAKINTGASSRTPVVTVPTRIRHRGVDPFRIPWTVPPPPPYVFESILPVRIATEDIEPPIITATTVREEPTLRVSGIMTGDGVFAILEQPGHVDIVKPGSTVDLSDSRSYTVMSIKDDTVTLESKVGLVTYQQVVPLSDAPIGTNAGSFGAGGNNSGGRPSVGAPGSGGPRPGGGMPMPGGAGGPRPKAGGGGAAPDK